MKTINKGNATLFHAKGRPYTTVSNKVVESIRNPDSLAIWTFLQTKDNNWTVVASWLQKHFGIGKDRYRAAMKRLEEMGLVYYVAARCSDTGHLKGTRVIVNYEPVTESTENPTVGKPERRLDRQSEKQLLPIKDSIPIKETTNAEPSSADCDSSEQGQSTTSAKEVEQAFEIYWQAGMVKQNKKKALSLFTAYVKKEKLCPAEFAEQLASDVKARIAAQQMGFDRLHPTTYLANERWEDEIVADASLPYARDTAGSSDYMMGI